MSLQENRQDASFFLKGHGGLAGEIGRGREKTARAVGHDKVLIEYHAQENKELATAEYVKAQYYMHRILHLLLPNNFPKIFADADSSILIERIQDTPVLVKARKINELYINRSRQHEVTTEMRDWWQR